MNASASSRELVLHLEIKPVSEDTHETWVFTQHEALFNFECPSVGAFRVASGRHWRGGSISHPACVAGRGHNCLYLRGSNDAYGGVNDTPNDIDYGGFSNVLLADLPEVLDTFARQCFPGKVAHIEVSLRGYDRAVVAKMWIEDGPTIAAASCLTSCLTPCAPTRTTRTTYRVPQSLHPQHQQILKYMRLHGEITPLIGFSLGIFRLAARIFDLRAMGYNITTKVKYDCNKRQYASYRFAG